MKTLCAALCGVSGFLLLAACEPTYETPPPVRPTPTAMYPAPAPATVAVVPSQRSCIYTAHSYASGAALSPPELPGTTLMCLDGAWHTM
jgi:hypothetical protein